jgi:hypothetical protein
METLRAAILEFTPMALSSPAELPLKVQFEIG